VSDGKCGASLVMTYAIIITNSISHHHMAYTNILEASGENRELFSTTHVLASSHPPIITIYLEASLLIIFTLIHIYVFGGLTSGITKYIALCRACTASPLLWPRGGWYWHERGWGTWTYAGYAVWPQCHGDLNPGPYYCQSTLPPVTAYLKPVFRTRNIFIRIRIRRSLPLLSKSGSGSFPILKPPFMNVYSDCLLCVSSFYFCNYFSCY
jgi:hypothetical protein